MAIDKCFASKCIEAGGSITPLLIPSELTNGTSLFNPSVYNDNGKLLLNLRHCQYTFYHSERGMFEHEYGPLLYLNPENDITLTTTNYLCLLDPNTYEISAYDKVDTTKFDKMPLWQFVGLEDARVVRWNNALYLCGVRRDTTPNGVGRMEMSEIQSAKEVSRYRVPTLDETSYCEKNWAPIVDMPYHFVKWSSPLEIVKVNFDQGTELVHIGTDPPSMHNYRGGSQIIPVRDHYLGLFHTVRLLKSEAGRKDAIYKHAFIMWDKNWNRVKITKEFLFMNSSVEFCCGMAEHGDKILMSFGQSDNAAFLLSAPTNFILDYIERDPGESA